MTISAPSWAGEQAAASESLFQQGRSLIDEGRVEEGCTALEASQKLEPAVGTLLNLARCRELLGKVATAWSTFSEAEALAVRLHDPARAALARENRERLEPQLSYMLLEIEEMKPDTRVTLDGSVVPRESVGLRVAINAGDHLIEVVDPGHDKMVIEFEITKEQEGRVKLLRVPPRVPQANLSIDGPESSGELEGKHAVDPLAASPTPQRRPLRGLGVGLTLAAVAGTALGSFLLVDAFGRAESADCDENDQCSKTGIEQRAHARRELVAGYATLGGSFLMGGLGVFFVLHSPARRQANSGSALTSFDVGFRGQF